MRDQNWLSFKEVITFQFFTILLADASTGFIDGYVAAEARASFYEDHSHHYLTLHHTRFAENVLYNAQ